MRWFTTAGVGLVALLLAREATATGEAARYYCVELSAQVSTSPPRILLNWPLYTNATSFTVYRRNLEATSWGSGTSLGGSAVSYTDTTVSVGSAYEYRVTKFGGGGGSGYVYAGIESPAIEGRGKVILLVNSTTATNLSAELARLQMDLVGDGWTILRHDIPRAMAVTNVKAIVKADYDADTNNVKSLFVFGRVPVPFSGNTNPDGHGARAFPTDLYYAELYGTTWTDTSVSQTTWSDPANWNVPGDGKPDQSNVASVPELESGRVDMYNMPSFAAWSEQDLLKRYLDKDHAFRQAQMNIQRRALVYDSWDLTTAQEGWRNFAPFFGPTNAFSQLWWTMETNSYLWAYSCGYNDSQTGPPSDFAARQLNTVFTMRFGSWSGDWEDSDSIMRCILASAPSGLTCSWSGGGYLSYYWYYHPMALGQTAGYSARYTQAAAGSAPVYFELMGDPTLRMHPVAPPRDLTATTNGAGDVVLTWTASADPVAGYHVYSSADPAGPFTRLNGTFVTGGSYTNVSPPAGTNTYMVRAVRLETSASGSYFNPSQGVFARYPDVQRALVVQSPRGTSDPPIGTNFMSQGAYVACAMLSAVVTNGSTQYVSKGWAGTGSVSPNGTAAATSLILDTDSVLTWLWETNYWLDVSSAGNGTVNPSNAWYLAGRSVTVTAAPNVLYRFAQWTGNVPPGSDSINPLTVTMDQARTLVAHFELPPNTTNAVPYAESFETYPPGFALPGSNGWYGTDAQAAVVSTNPTAIAQLAAFVPACQYPLITNHAQVAGIRGEVSNMLAGTSNVVIWTDMMVKPTYLMGTPPPDLGADSQAGLCIDTNGLFNVWRRDLAAATNGWVSLPYPRASTSEWTRLSIKADYGTEDAVHSARYFQVYLDGLLVTNPAAYTQNDGSGVPGGTWFAMAAVGIPTRLQSLTFGGEGFLDDLVVSTRRPLLDVGSNGTPEWWLVLHGLTNGVTAEELGDADGDGLLNWQEWVAGTDPSNGISVLRFVDISQAVGGRLPVSFESVQGRTYRLWSTTELAPADWTVAPYAWTPGGTLGTNAFTGTGGTMMLYIQPTASQHVYRIEVYR